MRFYRIWDEPTPNELSSVQKAQYYRLAQEDCPEDDVHPEDPSRFVEHSPGWTPQHGVHQMYTRSPKDLFRKRYWFCCWFCTLKEERKPRPKKKDCLHHDIGGNPANTNPAHSHIKQQLIDVGMRKMFWCTECGQTWFT